MLSERLAWIGKRKEAKYVPSLRESSHEDGCGVRRVMSKSPRARGGMKPVGADTGRSRERRQPSEHCRRFSQSPSGPSLGENGARSERVGDVLRKD